MPSSNIKTIKAIKHANLNKREKKIVKIDPKTKELKTIPKDGVKVPMNKEIKNIPVDKEEHILDKPAIQLAQSETKQITQPIPSISGQSALKGKVSSGKATLHSSSPRYNYI